MGGADGQEPGADVVSLASYRKTLEGRKPLYVTHLSGRVRGGHGRPEADFGTRLDRIRARIERINRLMDDIRETTSLEEKLDDAWD